MLCILESHTEWQKLDEGEMIQKSKKLDMYLCGDTRGGEDLLQRNKINELSAIQTCKSFDFSSPYLMISSRSLCWL